MERGQQYFDWTKDGPFLNNLGQDLERYRKQAEAVYTLLHAKYGIRDPKEVFIRNAVAYMFGMATEWNKEGSAYDRAEKIIGKTQESQLERVLEQNSSEEVNLALVARALAGHNI